jgi:putative oxidoreductase
MNHDCKGGFNELGNDYPWLLRIGIGSVFIYHGLTKFPQASGMAQMMGMPIAMIVLLGILETLGGALVLLGGFGPAWLTRLGSLILIPIMLGAIVMVHWGRWNFAPSATHPMGGMEFQVLTLLVLAYLLFQRRLESVTP